MSKIRLEKQLMKLAELIDYCEYNIPVIEFYNKENELEYLIDLNTIEFEDVDIIYSKDAKPFGILKLKKTDDKESECNA
tara:strand:+ start:217 stop:453 length:237 start_codon:yes stop_codon:yes gene_type:complete